MLKLHPEKLKRGEDEFVVLPYEEFVQVQERLADAEDVLELRRAKAKEGSVPGRSLDEVKKELGLT